MIQIYTNSDDIVMSKQVLEITGEPIGTGGQEMFIINVLRNINMDSLRIDWLTPYFCENNQYKNEIENRGGQVFCMNLPFSPGKSRLDVIKPLYRFLKNHPYDVVHIHSGSLSILATCSFISRISGVKNVIVHSHTTGLVKGVKFYALKLLFYPLIRFAPTKYCACSKAAGEWKFPHSVSNRTIILKNGIDLDAFRYNRNKESEIRSKLGIGYSTILIGHVGRFSFVKNHVFLIRLMEYLVSKSFDCKMMLIGDGEILDDIKSLVSQKQLNDKIIFVGATPCVNEYIQAMDVFVLPSRWEGLPIVGVEAQAAGVPMLVSDKVSKDMKLAKNVKYLPIDNIEVWANEITKVRRQKTDNYSIIKEAGYDITDTAEILKNLYLGNKNI